MEARLEADLGHFYGVSGSDYRGVGTRSVEWKLKDWKWDGDLFLARSINPVVAVAVPPQYLGQQFFPLDSRATAGNSSNSSSSCSDEVNLRIQNGKREVEKRSRVIEVEDDRLEDKASSLTLKLGGQGYSIAEINEGNSGKKAKVVGASTNRSACQVVDCSADLSNAKDYHRRHKVCEMHSKATRALVGNIMQRFCQQCSRFHALQEFDEGKRSCRRRLAGHNKRRRKTNHDTSATTNPPNDDQTSSYLLISLLKILSNTQTNQSNQVADQDLLTHLLRSLTSNQAGHGSKNVSTLLQESQTIFNGGVSVAKSEATPTLLSKGVEGTTPSRPMLQPHTEPQGKPNNFDLNDVYVDFDDGTEDLERSPVPANLRTEPLDCPSWMQPDSHHSSPPQTSRTSDSASGQSPSSSSGDTQSRTDRIVFKLFGKEPNDFPILVRAQILDWLAHSPTDIESYIRPGCIVLTVYLRQEEDAWKELCFDLSTSLSRLLHVSDDTFWKMGWIYIRVQHQMALIYNGQFVLKTSLPYRSISCSKILRVSPIAVSASESTQFLVRGFNLSLPSTKLHCTLEGKYLLQEEIDDLVDDGAEKDDELQCVKFSCAIPSVTGRGFIEIEDGGLSSSFFPFIVAENSICLEICTLESTLESLEADSDTDGTIETESKNEAVEFINEMGWILHRSGSRSRLGHLDPNTELFSFKRFRWLVEFSMDRDWCAVVKKLLDMMLEGAVGAEDHLSLYSAVLDMGLVHRAVRRNSRPLVELLLRYVPHRVADNLGPELELILRGSNQSLLFRPDVMGPAGLTPLHIAAGKDGSEDVLDALTEDPGMVGIKAWKNARDSTGSTPEDYARLRGHFSYIHLVQRKLNQRQPLPPPLPHVILAIPDIRSNNTLKEKAGPTSSFSIATPHEVKQSCKMCDTKKLRYGMHGMSLLYRPAMLSMVAIAAVCVCVALLFKSCPEVLYVFRPFRWEMLEFGTS